MAGEPRSLLAPSISTPAETARRRLPWSGKCHPVKGFRHIMVHFPHLLNMFNGALVLSLPVNKQYRETTFFPAGHISQKMEKHGGIFTPEKERQTDGNVSKIHSIRAIAARRTFSPVRTFSVNKLSFIYFYFMQKKPVDISNT